MDQQKLEKSIELNKTIRALDNNLIQINHIYKNLEKLPVNNNWAREQLASVVRDYGFYEPEFMQALALTLQIEIAESLAAVRAEFENL